MSMKEIYYKIAHGEMDDAMGLEIDDIIIDSCHSGFRRVVDIKRRVHHDDNSDWGYNKGDPSPALITSQAIMHIDGSKAKKTRKTACVTYCSKVDYDYITQEQQREQEQLNEKYRILHELIKK